MAAAVVGVLVGGYLIWGFVSTRRELASLEPRLEQVQDEHKRFEGLLQQKKRAETIRDSLLAQIGTIRAVDGNRYVWPHVLDEVAKSLPPYTWLTSLAVQGMVAVVDSADTTRAADAVQDGGPHHGSSGLHPLPPAARGLALASGRDAARGQAP